MFELYANGNATNYIGYPSDSVISNEQFNIYIPNNKYDLLRIYSNDTVSVRPVFVEVLEDIPEAFYSREFLRMILLYLLVLQIN